jgi:hypothetical protein
MQMENTEVSLSELLGRSIKDFEKIEDDPKTLTFVARRLGNIVKHMNDLCEDLQPRGGRRELSQHPHQRTIAAADRIVPLTCPLPTHLMPVVLSMAPEHWSRCEAG